MSEEEVREILAEPRPGHLQDVTYYEAETDREAPDRSLAELYWRWDDGGIHVCFGEDGRVLHVRHTPGLPREPMFRMFARRLRW